MTNPATRPWTILLPLIAVLCLAAIWTVYWFVALGMVKDRMASERSRFANDGLTLDCSEESWGGYPFHFEWRCSSPVLTRQTLADARSGDLLLVALAYAPWQVVALLDGPTTLAGKGIVPVTATHGRIMAAVTLDQDWKPRLSAEIPKLAIPDLLSVEQTLIHTRPAPGNATDVAASLTGGIYRRPDRPELVLDQADLTGTLLPDPSLAVERFEFRQGTIRYWGSGSLSLDAEHRVAGTIATETNDLNGLLGILGPHLSLTDQQGAGLRTVLGLLGNEAKADVISRDGQLFVGPFKVYDVPPFY